MADDDASYRSDNSEQEESAHTAEEEPFALNPAQATGAAQLKFSKKLHRAHYDGAVKSLYPETTDRFDLTQDKLHEFLSKVKHRAHQFSLSTIDVPADMNDPHGDTVNLAASYGTITEAHLRQFAATYMGQQNRAAQDDHMLAQLLINSCSENAQAELADHEEDYTVNGSACGALLLQVIMREASVEVTTDPDLVRQELANTHLKFKELGYDIEALNKWVNRKVKQLRANGEQSTDLRTHLFKAYRSSTDKDFKNYISTLKETVRDTGQQLTAKQLMAKAKLKMKDLQRERTLDAANANSDDPILALQAQFDKRLSALEKGNSPGKGNPRQPGKPKQGKQNDRRVGRGKKQSVPFPKELKQAGPPADSKVPREIAGVKYYFCEHHKKWGRHLTSACKAKAALQQATSPGGANPSRMARAARAIAAIATGEDE